MENCLIFGSSGHARIIIDILEKSNLWAIKAIVSSSKPEKDSVEGYPIVQESPEIISQTPFGIIAIGDNWTREQVSKKILKICPHFKFINAIHPSSIIAKNTRIGEGCVVAAGAIINTGSNLHDHCLINTGAIVEHDNQIFQFSSIAPGAVTAGNVSVGAYSAIGLGAKINHKLSVGIHTVIGSGSIVTRSIPDYSVAYGSPCKVIRPRKPGDTYL